MEPDGRAEALKGGGEGLTSELEQLCCKLVDARRSAAFEPGHGVSDLLERGSRVWDEALLLGCFRYIGGSHVVEKAAVNGGRGAGTGKDGLEVFVAILNGDGGVGPKALFLCTSEVAKDLVDGTEVMLAKGRGGLGALTVDIVPLGVAETPFELSLEVMSVGLSGDEGGASERLDVVEMTVESTYFLGQILGLSSGGTGLGEFLCSCLFDGQAKMEPASVEGFGGEQGGCADVRDHVFETGHVALT